jgi:hypothetical protein
VLIGLMSVIRLCEGAETGGAGPTSGPQVEATVETPAGGLRVQKEVEEQGATTTTGQVSVENVDQPKLGLEPAFEENAPKEKGMRAPRFVLPGRGEEEKEAKTSGEGGLDRGGLGELGEARLAKIKD